MPTKEEFRAVFNACSTGRETPTCAVMFGDAINAMIGGHDYDPLAAYIVTPQGISRVKDDDE